MKIPRLSYDPGAALSFYEESLSALGGLCERTWHDRLEIVAEGTPARLWNEQGSLHSQDLVFAPADARSARDASREVFPGCPLTFRLAELLRPHPVVLDKIVLRDTTHAGAPGPEVLEKLWRTQYPQTRRWRLPSDLKPVFHFSLVGVVRCEIQAIDQHWSVHRVGISLPGGETDDLLVRQIPFLEVSTDASEAVDWIKPEGWTQFLKQAIELEIGPDLDEIRRRQEQYLERELQRIDEYFAHYEKELAQRASRKSAAKVKTTERLDAARAEHARRRGDQVARHEIRVQPHVDTLLLVAERAWAGPVELEEQRASQILKGTFVPRSRRWLRQERE